MIDIEINNYYQILGLSNKFSAFGLLIKYFQLAKIALNSGNSEAFIKLRMGLEVFRNEDSYLSYIRLYRKYILNYELNYPEIKIKEMLDSIRAKEVIGKQEAVKILAKDDSYLFHAAETIILMLFSDLLEIFNGFSGLIYILGGIYIAFAIHVVGGMLILFAGIFILRSNLKSFIRH